MHCRYGHSKRLAKRYKLATCYLYANVSVDGVDPNLEGFIQNVGCFSERYPTNFVGEKQLLLMKTTGQTYQKASDAMEHAVKINRRYNWALAWIGNDYKLHMAKLELWRKARNNELHVKSFNLESKFLEAIQEG